MKNTAHAILLSLALVACSGNSTKNTMTHVDSVKVRLQAQMDSLEPATTDWDTIITAREEERKKNSTPHSSPSTPHSALDAESPSTDNLRGFDPSFEDDLPDNGMSRYMENNDDEGWD